MISPWPLQTGLNITVCHYPPGTSKWNKVEHRLFSFISTNWRGRPLTDYQVIIETIASTTTDTGLTVHAVLDPHSYPTGVPISNSRCPRFPSPVMTSTANGTTPCTPGRQPRRHRPHRDPAGVSDPAGHTHA